MHLCHSRGRGQANLAKRYLLVVFIRGVKLWLFVSLVESFRVACKERKCRYSRWLLYNMWQGSYYLKLLKFHDFFHDLS